jgi:hypothetical protein
VRARSGGKDVQESNLYSDVRDNLLDSELYGLLTNAPVTTTRNAVARRGKAEISTAILRTRG